MQIDGSLALDTIQWRLKLELDPPVGLYTIIRIRESVLGKSSVLRRHCIVSSAREPRICAAYFTWYMV